MSNEMTGAGGLSRTKLLKIALIAFGVSFMPLYPLAFIWPSGWSWHQGMPHESQYFMMIVGVYATLGGFLIYAASKPAAHLSLIWFTVWSSAAHGLIMAVQSVAQPEHMIHLVSDVPALLLVAVVLGFLAPSAKAM